ncbi:LysR family transcriptional regulator [Clostridium sp. CM028]|uniref:LysR family transcriptional regulator n=1 Tax=Clostridium TaxID=1485 RepID=UPI0013EEBA2D|nr:MULTISPECIES: LysR family transcriptional regulator [Clostridium]MBU3090643.1 LysR family transcriptional regulator [Clostridium sp. CF011]MBW9144363.1 LysR family transcriptional regulator [Clostridium sp. CM027]MBW9149399.1 LysR family transcriptional regulator [Clostridium sp. CM028]MBZ9608573.1 LysR family transcriptional regulator [Clostridium estertheticum]UVE41006.1 LysR family transcriptional regulator [Clostridium sp. CM027]
MELRQLEYFQMVCQLNNITQAAKKLYVTQPSITNSIKNLEKELSIVLFDRSKKQLSLTDEGKIFLKRVDDILRQVTNAVAEMKDCQDLKNVILTIGIPPLISTFIFPKVFIDFQKSHPNIKLNISEYGSLTTKQMVENGDLDLGLIIIDSSDKSLASLPILNSELFVCLKKEHPLSKQPTITFKDIKNEPIILLKEGFYIRQKILESFNECNIQPNVILSSTQLETIKGLITNGVGISFLLKEIVEDNENITKVPFSTAIPIKIALVWKKDRYLSNASKAFIDFLITNPITPLKS